MSPIAQKKPQPHASFALRGKRDSERSQRRAGHALVAMALFLALSLAAFRGFPFIPPLGGQALELLGAPPSPQAISIWLVIYSFAALILILARMMGGSRQSSAFAHVGYLAGFYLFYHLANALEDNVWAVFSAGLVILSLEAYRLWQRANDTQDDEAVEDEKTIDE